jgi:hypothetical protein
MGRDLSSQYDCPKTISPPHKRGIPTEEFQARLQSVGWVTQAPPLDAATIIKTGGKTGIQADGLRSKRS